jgi:hypothetical protein
MIREEIEMTRFRLNAIYTLVRIRAVLAGIVPALMVLAGIALNGPQAAAQERATQTPTVKQVASDVYFFFDFNGSNAVFLVTDDGVLLIDTRTHPREGRKPFRFRARSIWRRTFFSTQF